LQFLICVSEKLRLLNFDSGNAHFVKEVESKITSVKSHALNLQLVKFVKRRFELINLHDKKLVPSKSFPFISFSEKTLFLNNIYGCL